jgi:hypothetical protein
MLVAGGPAVSPRVASGWRTFHARVTWYDLVDDEPRA